MTEAAYILVAPHHAHVYQCFQYCCRSGGGPAVAVRGVQLEVDLALTQNGARTLASGRAGTPNKDNRNLYLVWYPSLVFYCPLRMQPLECHLILELSPSAAAVTAFCSSLPFV